MAPVALKLHPSTVWLLSYFKTAFVFTSAKKKKSYGFETTGG